MFKQRLQRRTISKITKLLEICGENLTMMEAAKKLNMPYSNVQYVISRYIPEWPKKKPGPKIDPEYHKQLRELASDPSINLKKAGQILGRSPSGIHSLCRYHHIKWIAPYTRRNTFSRYVATEMREGGSTYADIGRALGVTRQRVFQILNGRGKKVAEK